VIAGRGFHVESEFIATQASDTITVPTGESAQSIADDL